MTSAFLDAAASAVYQGCISSEDAISTGALRDLQGFESIVDMAIAELTPSEEQKQRAAEFSLKLKNKEFNEEYAQLHYEDDSGWTANEFLKSYVGKVRATEGWKRLFEHRHRVQLLPYWLNQLGGNVPPATAELKDVYLVARHTPSESRLWFVLSKYWVPDFEQDLEDLVKQGRGDSDVRVGALTCVVEQAEHRLPAMLQELVDAGNEARLVELSLELGEIRDRRDEFDGSEHSDAAIRAAALLPQLFREVSDAAYALEINAPITLSEHARALLIRIAPHSEQVRRFRIQLDEHLCVGSAEDARWLLDHTEDEAIAELAINFFIRRGLMTEIEAGLKHRFADVVAPALIKLATPMPAPLPAFILALAEHRGSRVCQALVELLDAKPHLAHRAALLHLAKNDWSGHISYDGDEVIFPIAQRAIEAMGKLQALGDEQAEELYKLAIDTRDPDLRYGIFELLVEKADPRYQEALMDIALNPGGANIRGLAAHSIMVGYEHVVSSVTDRVTPEVLSTKIPRVASRLLLLVALHGEVNSVMKAAEVLSLNAKRRVLVLLAIWAMREKNPDVAGRIARMLPDSSVGPSWALAGCDSDLADTELDDLGDPACVEQVFQFMQPRKH